ncbi:MAG TPA: hypothetical protein VJL08_01970, partial [Dehalococcoidia bacterium]|nr:hypothetical protein [Dehalococcoidia bacterium]
TRRLNSQEEEVVVALPNTGFCPHCRAPTTTVHQVQPQASRLLWSFVNGHRLWLVVLRRIRESNKS